MRTLKEYEDAVEKKRKEPREITNIECPNCGSLLKRSFYIGGDLSMPGGPLIEIYCTKCGFDKEIIYDMELLDYT